MTTRQILYFALLGSLFIFTPGCSDSDDPVNPPIPGGDDPAVQLVQAEGPQLAKALVEALPDVTALGLKTIDDAWYDETCGCWSWSVMELDEGNPYWSRSANFTATFYNGETPQMTPEGADRIQLTLSFMYDWSEFFENSYRSRSAYFDLDLEATGWASGALTSTGSGWGSVSGGEGNYTDDEWDGFYEEFDIDLAMTLPMSGCPTGSLDLAAEEAGFAMGFNGTPSASWAYTYGGNPIDSGTFPLGCNTR